MKQKRMELADQCRECTQKAAAYDEAVKKGEGEYVRPENQVTTAQCDEIMKTMEALK